MSKTRSDIIWTETIVEVDDFEAMEAKDGWPKQEQRIAELRRLEDNWDGEGAVAPSAELIESVAGLPRQHKNDGRAAPSGIVPTVDGTLFLEWQAPPIFASLEVRQPYEGEWLIERPG